MNRHSFRWDALIFGLLFLSAIGGWSVWSADLLTPREFAYAGAASLIVLGVLGIVGTLVKSRPAPFAPEPTPTTPTEEASDDAEEADPQP